MPALRNELTLPRLVGVEHEYALARGDERVDVRALLPTLDVPGRRIDPGDRHAIRTTSGVVLTADGREAEVATPPVDIGPGFADRLDAWADAAERTMLSALPADLDVQGMSTHWNVSLPSPLAHRVGPMFARRFGVPLLLLTDRPDADGLLVRPRAGRLELGTDYAAGHHRRAAAALVAGGVAACVAVLRGQRPVGALPPLLAVRLQPARERYGWYLDRRIGGHDVLAAGSATPLRLVGGAATDAGRQLAAAAASARDALADLVAPADVAALDAAANGDLARATGRAVQPAASPSTPASPFGTALVVHRRPTFTAAAVVATWWVTVFVLAGRRRAYAVVPSAHLQEFLDRLQHGSLDDTVERYLRRPPTGRTVRGWPDLDRVRFCDEVPHPSAWVPPERDRSGVFVATWRDPTTAGGPAPADRPGKHVVPPPPGVPVQPEGGRPWWPWVVGLMVTIGLVIGGFVAFGGGGEQRSTTTTGPSPTGPSQTGPGTTTATSPTTSPPSTTTPPTSPPTTATPTTDAPRLVTGTYTGAVTVADDPAGHACCVDPNETWQVLQVRNTQTGVITLNLADVFDGVTLTVDIPATGAPVDVATTATIAGFPGTEVRFSGTVTPEGGVVGTLTVGGNGTLPTGRPITFDVHLEQVQSG